jgi:hypothetical protein
MTRLAAREISCRTALYISLPEKLPDGDMRFCMEGARCNAEREASET